MSDQPDGEQDYLRLSCNRILQVAGTDSDSEHFEPTTSEGDQLLSQSDQTSPLQSSHLKTQRQRAALIRVLALLCACSLSVGSH